MVHCHFYYRFLGVGQYSHNLLSSLRKLKPDANEKKSFNCKFSGKRKLPAIMKPVRAQCFGSLLFF